MKASILTLTALASMTLSSPTPRATKVKYAGVNIAGFDFGCTIDGTCSLTGSSKPYDIVSGANALGQMNHFVKDDSLNAFRLPVGWQFLVNGQLGGQCVLRCQRHSPSSLKKLTFRKAEFEQLGSVRSTCSRLPLLGCHPVYFGSP